MPKALTRAALARAAVQPNFNRLMWPLLVAAICLSAHA